MDFEPIRPEEKPITVVKVEDSYNERMVNDQLISALGNDPAVYQWQGYLVEVRYLKERDATAIETGAPKGTPIICAINEQIVRERISEYAELGDYEFNKKAGGDVWKPKHIKQAYARAIHSRGEWNGIRPIHGVIESPTFLDSGDIIQKPGYHEQSGLLYNPTTEFTKVDESPTQDDAKDAIARIEDIVFDFPFKSDAHKSVFVAAVLTLFARNAISGPVPLFFIDGNNRGVGKTLLADIVALAVSGRPIAKASYPKKDEEMSKQLTSIAIAGGAMQLFDNVPNDSHFGSASLDAALTSQVWQGRILSRSEMKTVPFKTVIFATGNGLNMADGSDTVRRIAYIKLDSKEEKPDSREDFKHGSESDLREMVIRNRGSFAADALTILRAYHVAKRPKQDLPAWGSFNAWSDLIRQAIVWCGRPDPLDTRHDLEIADQGGEDLGAVVHVLSTLTSDGAKTADEIGKALHATDFQNLERDEKELIDRARVLICPKSNQGAKTTGRKIAKFKEKVYDGKRIETRKTNGRSVWEVKDVTRKSA